MIRLTIDGNSGSGKTTLARTLADALGCKVLEVGFLLRYVAFKFSGDKPSYFEIDQALDNVELSDLADKRILSAEVRSATSGLASDSIVEAGMKRAINRIAQKEENLIIMGRDTAYTVSNPTLRVNLIVNPQIGLIRRVSFSDSRGDDTAVAEKKLRGMMSDDQNRYKPHPRALKIDTSYLKPQEVSKVVLDALTANLSRNGGGVRNVSPFQR